MVGLPWPLRSRHRCCKRGSFQPEEILTEQGPLETISLPLDPLPSSQAFSFIHSCVLGDVQVNRVANGIRQKLPSKKWPLVVVHNRRISGKSMDDPINSKLLEKWKNADAIYATPTGSNDDW